MRLAIRNAVLRSWQTASASFAVLAFGSALTMAAPTATGQAQDLGRPTGTDRQVAQLVSNLMENDHLSSRDLDDEISRRAMTSYIDSLDPTKVYFYQSDVDEFMREQTQLDNMLKDGRLDFPLTVFERFLQRIDDRVATVDDLLSGGFDFTLDEELITDPDALEYPKTPEEARDRWRKRLKYNLLVLKSEETEDQDAVEKLRKRYSSFAKRMHQFNAQEVIEMFITAVTTSFDPHTTYLSKRTYENFLIQMRLNLEGIGASLQSQDGVTVVKRIVPGGAADRDGRLKVEDRIVSVAQGESGEPVDVADMKLDDVVQMIRGKAGTIVRLGVMPESGDGLTTVQITREKIELKDSEAQAAVFDQGTKADGSPFRVGVIDLPSFYLDMEGARLGVDGFKSTTADVRKILEGFEKDNVDAVVLDLRRNGGGSLSEAINCTGLFIDVGPVVQVKDAYGQVRSLYDEESGTAWDGPLVVMTSKFSASASEILAGAIQDYGRGLVVGDEATHGKGTVQSLVNLGGVLFRVPNPPKTLGALKITMQQFYRPSGDSTQKRGVLADIVLPSISNHMDVGEADLDYPVEFDKVRRAEFKMLPLVNATIVDKVKEASERRMSESEDFRELRVDIERYREQKARQTVTLNEQKFFERRKELDAEQQEEATIEDQINQDSTAIERDFYLDEVLSITVDYLKALATDDVASRN